MNLPADLTWQIDEELQEYDHSDQPILMKLIEVYEQRMAKQTARLDRNRIVSRQSQNQVNNTGDQSTAASQKGGQSQNNTQYLSQKRESSNGIVNIDTDRQRIEDNASNANGKENDQDSASEAANANRRLAKVQNATAKVSKLNLPGVNKGPASDNNSSIARKSATQQIQQKGFSSKQMAAQSMNVRERKQMQQLKKDYRKYAIEFMTKEYWRAFEALVGSNDLDWELVIHSFKSS